MATSTLDGKLDELLARAEDSRLGPALKLVAAVDGAWGALSVAQHNRLKRYVVDMPRDELAEYLSAAWALADLDATARSRIERRDAWYSLSDAKDPPAEWIQIAVDQMVASTSWDDANPPRLFLVPNAERISEVQVKALLEAAKKSKVLRTSWALQDVLAATCESPNLGTDIVKACVEQAGLVDAFSSQKWWPKPEESSS